jgi:hypothetical protein
MSAAQPRGTPSRACVPFALVSALMLVTTLPTPGHTQVVRGAVTEAESGRPVAGAIVRLIAADSQQVAMLITAADGSFVLVAPRGGTHVLEVEHVHFDPIRTAAFTVPHTGAAARLVRLTRRTLRAASRAPCEPPCEPPGEPACEP